MGTTKKFVTKKYVVGKTLLIQTGYYGLWQISICFKHNEIAYFH